MNRRVTARNGLRQVDVMRARQELFATGRQVDSAAAQVLMLGEDDFVSDAEHDELEELGQALRRVSEDIHARVDEL